MRADRTSDARTGRTAAILAAAILLGGAGNALAADPKPAADAKGGAVPPAAMKEAQEIFSTRCSVCHGTSGKGDGPGAAALNPKPRNLTDPEWQKSVTDEYIEKIVQYGGTAVGKSAMMPNNPDLNSKPDVVKGLRAVVRELGKRQ